MASGTQVVLFLAAIAIAPFFFGGESFDAESIKGKSVLVTGASSGIGEQVAYEFAKLGAKLVITARRAELLEKVAKKCSKKGALEVRIVAANMSNSSDREKLSNEVQKFFGKKLDFLILNHAMISYEWWTGSRANLTMLEQMLNVNFVSYVDLTALLIGSLEKRRGRIGVVSSLAGKLGNTGFTHYSSTKFALQGFFSSLRQEMRNRKTGVSVTLAVFGPVNSEHAVQVARENNQGANFESLAGEVEDAAKVFIQGVWARQYEIFYPKFTFFLNFINGFIPGYLENLNNWLQNGDRSP